MRAVIQRVRECSVYVDGAPYSSIGMGLLVFLCVCSDDTFEDVRYVLRKVVNMRIFEDRDGKFNLSLLDVGGSLMVVSQFTLAADTRKGNRPSYFYAMPPEKARAYYELFISEAVSVGVNTKTGEFGAKMDIYMVNHGPVTVYLDSRDKLGGS